MASIQHRAVRLIALVALAILLVMGAALMGLGVLSSSVLVGFLDRRFATGFTALSMHIAALAGIPCGVLCFWVVQALLELHTELVWIVLFGVLCGLAGGATVGLLFALACQRIYAWLRDRWQARVAAHQR